MTSSYQGYARSRGFSPQQVSSENISRIREEGSRILDGMRAAQAAELRNRKAVESQIRDNNQLEQQQREKNFQREQEFNQVVRNQIQSNAAIERTNFDNEQRSIQRTYDSLSKLSKSAGEIVNQYRQYRIDRDYEDELSKILMGNVDPKDVLNQLAGEQASRIAEEDYQQSADNLQANGVDPLTVARVRSNSPGRQYARDQINARLSTQAYPDWLAQQMATDNTTEIVLPTGTITPASATTSAEKAAATNVLAIKYMKENGLYGLGKDFLTPTLLSIRDENDKIIARTKKNETKAINDGLVNEKESLLLSGAGSANLNQRASDYYYTLIRSGTDDNGIPLTPKAARAKLLDLIFGIDSNGKPFFTPSEQDEFVNNFTFTDQPNTPIGRRFSRDVDDARLKSRTTTQQRANLQNQEENQRQLEQTNAIRNFLINDWDGDEASLRDIEEAVGLKNPSALQLIQQAKTRTTEAKNDRLYEEIWSEKNALGTLTRKEIVYASGVSAEKRREWLDKLDESGGAVGPSKQEITDAKSWIDSELNGILDNLPADDFRSSSFKEAGRELSLVFQRAYAQAVRSQNPDPYKAGLEAVATELKTTKYQGKVVAGVVEFPQLKIKPGADTTIRDIDTTLRNTPGDTALDTKDLIPRTIIENYAAEAKLGRYPAIPRLAAVIAGRFNGNLNALDVLKRQADYYGIELPATLTQADEVRTQSPELKTLIDLLMYKPNPVYLQRLSTEAMNGGFSVNLETGEVMPPGQGDVDFPGSPPNANESGPIGETVGPGIVPTWRRPENMNPNLLE